MYAQDWTLDNTEESALDDDSMGYSAALAHLNKLGITCDHVYYHDGGLMDITGIEYDAGWYALTSGKAPLAIIIPYYI